MAVPKTFTGVKTASPAAVKRLMENKTKTRTSGPSDRNYDNPVGGMPPPTMKKSFTPTPTSQPTKPNTSTRNRQAIQKNQGLKNAAARKLSKMGQFKFGARRV